MKKPPNVQRAKVPQHLIRQMWEKYAPHSYEHQGIQNDAPARINEIEDDEDHFQTKVMNILGQDGTGMVPVEITESHEIQYFKLNVA